MLVDDEKLLAPIRVALPEWKPFIDEFGVSGLFNLIDVLEEKLLKQMMADLEGRDADTTGIGQAADIISAVEEAVVQRETASVKSPI